MNKEDVQHIINFLRDNEIETGHKRGVEPLEEMLKENEELKDMLKNRIKYTNELEQDLFENASNYVVSKDKIKDKIKELKEDMVQNGKTIDILYDILEGE